MPNLFRVEPPMNPSPSQDNVIANTKLLKETVGFTCKNLFDIEQYNGCSIFGDSQGAYLNTQTNGVTFQAHVKKNTDYTVSKRSGVGDSFIVAGFETPPTFPNTTPEANSAVLIDDSSLNSYTFNSDDYEYIAFTVNKTTSGTLTDIQAMIRDANLLDESYEAPNTMGTVKNFMSNISNTIKSAVFSVFYPVGTIYQTTDVNFRPSTAWGGTWEKIEGRFLLGSSYSHAINSTGGEETHLLTVSELPPHAHDYYLSSVEETELGEFYDGNDRPFMNYSVKRTSDTAGGNQAHNNMPPYYTVNIWKRTA